MLSKVETLWMADKARFQPFPELGRYHPSTLLWIMEKEHKTAAHYRELYLRWQSSGLTVGPFCQQESIKYATFRYWAKKFEQPDNVVPGFTELKTGKP